MALLHQSSHHTAFLSVNTNAQPEQRFKKIIENINKKRTYQNLIIGFIIPLYFLIVFNTMIGPFVFMNPIFQCGGQGSTQEQACQHLSQCRITNDFTAAYKNQLYCQKQTIRSTIQSIFGLGYLSGKLTFPVLCDTIGRRYSYRIALLMGITAMSILLLSIEYNSEVFMMVGELAAGIFGSGIAIMSFIYICDFCSEKVREFCLTTCWAVWGVAEMFFYILYEYIPWWRFYLTATLYVPITIIFIFLLFFQIQSPVYAVFVKKSPKKFDQIIDQLSKFNKFSQQSKASLKQEGRAIITALKKGKQNEIHLKQILSKIFCDFKNFKKVICLILSNLSYVFFYYGMQGSMETVGLSFGVNMFFVGLVQFVSYATVGYVTKKMKRKLGLLISIVISSVIGLSFLLDFVKDNDGLQTVFVVIIRVTLSYYFCFFVLIESQSLQVQIRSTSFALIEGSGQFGRIAAPFVINIMYNLKIAPIIIFSAFFLIFGALPSFILKQTKKSEQAKKSQYENQKQGAQRSEASIDKKLVDN